MGQQVIVGDEWVDIKEFNKYQVHPTLGIRNKKTNRILKGRLWLGYPRVTLMSNGKKHEVKIHRIVAEHFIKNPDKKNKLIVNHKNGDRADFSINNLEWMSQSENMFDRWANKGKRKKYIPEY
jgi:hypothetical protein